MNKTMRGLFTLTEWISKFAYVNILWIGFSLLGLVVLGFSPATVAMFTLIRKWIMGEHDVPVFQTFWTTYKKEFLKSNRLTIIFVFVAGVIFLDLYYMGLDSGQILQITHIPLYLFIFTIVFTAMYLVPVYVHYDVPFSQMIKNAFLIMLVNPISNIVMLIGIGTTLFVMSALPALYVFFGGSLTAAIMMSACYLAFQKIDRKTKEAPTT